MSKLDQFIQFDPPFNVTASSRDGAHDLPITASGVYVHGDYQYTYMHYAGESAGESYTEFILPSDPKFLRKFAKGIVEYAKKLENR